MAQLYIKLVTVDDRRPWSYFRHNDLPWNIRKFIHNKLNTVNFTHDLRSVSPWSESPWSHTDLKRLKEGMVGAQVHYRVTMVVEYLGLLT